MLNEDDQRSIAELGIGDFDEATQRRLLADYYFACDTRIALAVEDQLSDEQLAAFTEFSDAHDEAAVTEWLRSTLQDYDELVANQIAEVRSNLIRTLKQQ